MRPGATKDVDQLEQTFLANLPLIDRVTAIQARRHGLADAEAEDYASWAKARLIENGYAVFRAFAGRSSLATYLTAVLHNLLRDYLNARWGRWRPSAAATQAGPAAVRLEQLLARDGYTLREASQLLRGAGLALTDGEIARLAARLPNRGPGDEVSLDAVDKGVAQFQARAATPPEVADEARVVEAAVREVMATLPPEDALMLRMRFWRMMSVADIARALRLEQKPLYRRLEAIYARLRAELEARGVDKEVASDVLNREFRS